VPCGLPVVVWVFDDVFVGEVGDGGSFDEGSDVPFVCGASLAEEIVSARELVGGMASPSISEGGDIREWRSTIHRGLALALEERHQRLNSPRYPNCAVFSGSGLHKTWITRRTFVRMM